MSTLQEIETAVPQLSREELLQLRQWLDVLCEDQMELTDEVVGKLDQSRAEIAAGQFRTRQP
jgi:hypothetical protein